MQPLHVCDSCRGLIPLLQYRPLSPEIQWQSRGLMAYLTGRGLRNVSFELRNVSFELRNVSFELRNVSVSAPCTLEARQAAEFASSSASCCESTAAHAWITSETPYPSSPRYTPATNEGRARSLRISHTSRRAPLQPVILSQVPCTPYHPPNIAGVIRRVPLACDRDSGVNRHV